MKGKNELTLNESTMIEAVQEWVDARWSATKEATPQVVSVKPLRDGHTQCFAVKLTEPDGEAT